MFCFFNLFFLQMRYNFFALKFVYSVPETGSTKGRGHKIISFETRAKVIGNQIKEITDNDKKALKTEMESLDKEVEKGLISEDKAEEHTSIIETKIAIEEWKLS